MGGKPCVYYRASGNRSKENECEKDKTEQFMEFEESALGAIIGLATTAGIATSGKLTFQKDKFEQALNEASSKLSYQGLEGRVAISKLIKEWNHVLLMIAESKSKVESLQFLQREAKYYGIASTVQNVE